MKKNRIDRIITRLELIDKNKDLATIVSRKGKAGIYIHYPFCIQKCNYCDFFSIGNGRFPSKDEDRIFPAYQKELQDRLEEFPNWRNLEFDTIFLGGGTPSRMSHKGLEELLNSLSKYLSISQDAEISLEANPEDI
ncbi:MAG: hypothetical protein JJT78_01930, partial [Leptospira sp.]|nr:hypothetical protein [Leptospira sp.]